MKKYDDSVLINHNPNWPHIPYHPYRILIIGGSELGKTNVLLNLIKHQPLEIDRIYFYVKNPFESKYDSGIIKFRLYTRLTNRQFVCP